VKRIARQTISENNKLDAKLTTLIASDSVVNTDVFNYGHLTSQARQTEKRMKKLKGAEFDTLYLSELKAYALRNQGAIRADSPASESSQMRQVSQRIQTQSDQQIQQLRQAAQNENVKID
jgi:predicted outer membrane protein